jgi:hypothetical protein
MFSLNRGTLILENRIKTALNEAFLLNVSDYEIPYMIASGGIAAVPESKAVIESAIQEFVGQIRREMVVKGWSCETLPIVGIGGGAELLKDYLETVFIYEETGNPMFDNAIGLYELGACFK